MKSLRYLLAMVAVALFTAACVSEPVPYQKGEAEADGCYGVYFPVQDATGSHTYDPSQATEVIFKVARTNSNDAITVPVTYTESHEGIFNVGELKFDAGQSETTLKVTFPESGNGIDYKLSLAIEDPQYASKYNDGATNIDFSVLRVQWTDFLNPQTNEPAVFTFTQGWRRQVHEAYIKYYEVDGIRTAVATCIDKAEDGTPLGIWNDTQGVTFNFTWNTNLYNSDGYQVLDVPKQYFGFDYNDWVSKPEAEAVAPIYFYDWFHFLITDGGYAGGWPDWAAFLAKNPNSYKQSYYDGNGGFHFNLAYQVPALGGGFETDEFDVVALADGFIRTDYSLSLATDYTVEGVTPVLFEAGVDVAEIKYVVVPGEANVVVLNEQIAAIAAGTAENVLTLAADEMILDEEDKLLYGSVEVTCPSTGKYTIIAVSFDAEGKAHESSSSVFDYVKSDDSTYDVKFDVEVADTPARFAKEGHTIYNSFSFNVYGGNGLTDAKIGLYETKVVETAGIDAVVADLRYEDDKINKSVLPDTLARINTTAGYTDLYTGLKDNTSYTLVVWGTNGMQTSVVTAEYTTEKNPEVFKSLGTATYTDDIVGPLFQAPNVTYEVEVQESVDNPGKYRLVNPYGEAFPHNEPGDWDDSQDYYMIIDATDPSAVTIPEQDLGVDWGYGMMGVWCMVEYYLAQNAPADYVEPYYGTLKDGVITFPANALIVIDNDGLYVANRNGAFKVVLPSAAEDGGDDTPAEGGSEAASVNKSSVKTGEAAFELPMSTGRIAGAGIEPEVRTVKATAVVSANQDFRKSVNRNCEINHSNIEVNF